MFLKLLIVGIALFFIYHKLRGLLGSKELDKSSSEDMVKCDNCGVFFLKSEAVLEHGKRYCSKECTKGRS